MRRRGKKKGRAATANRNLLREGPAVKVRDWFGPVVPLENTLLIAGRTGVSAVDRFTGELTWALHTADTVVSKPVVMDGKVFIGCFNGDLIAVDLETGAQEWRILTDNKAWDFLAAGQARVFFTETTKRVCCVDARTGLVLWTFQAGGRLTNAPVLAGDLLYLGTTDGKVHAVDIHDGHEKWSYNKGDWRPAHLVCLHVSGRSAAACDSCMLGSVT